METIENKSDTVAGNQKSAEIVPLLWDVNQAANRLNVSVVSIRKLLRQNRLQRVPHFRKILIPDSSLQKFATSAL